MNTIKIGSLSMFGLILSIIISCSAKHDIYSTGVSSEQTIFVPYPVVEIHTKKDTIKPKQRTAAELRKQYGAIIDTLFSPEFNNMTTIIRGQQGSIDKLAGIIISLRGRSIAYRDSMQRINGKKDSELYELKKIAINESIKQQKQNKEQINKLNTIINVLIVYCFVSFLLIITLAIICRIIWIALKKLQKSKYE